MFPSAETSECRDVIVGDVKFGECPGQRLAIVLRVRTRSRHCSDVGDKRDIRFLQQVHEFRERPRRMSDGEDRETHTPLSCSLDHIEANRVRADANCCESAIIVAP